MANPFASSAGTYTIDTSTLGFSGPGGFSVMGVDSGGFTNSGTIQVNGGNAGTATDGAGPATPGNPGVVIFAQLPTAVPAACSAKNGAGTPLPLTV